MTVLSPIEILHPQTFSAHIIISIYETFMGSTFRLLTKVVMFRQTKNRLIGVIVPHSRKSQEPVATRLLKKKNY